MLRRRHRLPPLPTRADLDVPMTIRRFRRQLHLLLLAAVAALAGASAAGAVPLPLATLQARATGDVAAMIELGLRLENAEGVPRDYAAAAALYCRAATAG